METDPLARIAQHAPELAAEIRRRIAERVKSPARESGATKTTEHARDNGKVVIVCSHGDHGLFPTRDPHDAAHLTYGPDGKLRSAYVHGFVLAGARRRLYPPSHLSSAGFALDSSFDGAHERAGRLRKDLGVDLVGCTMAEAVHAALGAADHGRGISKVINRNRNRNGTHRDGKMEDEESIF